VNEICLNQVKQMDMATKGYAQVSTQPLNEAHDAADLATWLD
jgi:hypothetical protein